MTVTVRTFGSYQFESGGSVEIKVYGEVDSADAIDAIESLIALKRIELERRLAKMTAPPDA